FPQHAIYFEGVTAAEQRAWAESWVRARIPQAAALAPPPRRPGERKLRIAYFSGDFYDHPTALLLAGMLERHDRDRFELSGYSWARDEGSALRERVKKAFDRFVEVRDLSARAAARDRKSVV